MTDQQATAPAYQSPIPADHPSRKVLVSGQLDTDPAGMTNRELVQSYGEVRFQAGLIDLHSHGADPLCDNLYERAQHLQTEIIRRLGGIA